ncbi:MFS transporter [Bacillus subtilis subsp. subtilis]|nr:MFS transporter [Bacillus subtilis subsp. subtilis]
MSMIAALPRTTTPLLLLFACAAGLSVANVYYAQPLLDALAADLHIGTARIGAVIAATQLGSVIALLWLVPLGDRHERRRLMALQNMALVLALLGVASAGSATALLLGMLVVGLLGTAMTQGLIAYAAAAAHPHERGRVVGAAQAGVVIGLLLARVVAGGVADLGGWRAVYGVSAGLMVLSGAVLWLRLPRLPVPVAPPRASLLALLRQQPVLRRRGVLGLLLFTAFGLFWSTLALPLGAPPYALSHTAIGAFALVGLLGALAAARAGHWSDHGHAERISLVALLVLLLSWAPLAALPLHLGWLVLGVLLLDLAAQALHVTNQSLILAAAPDAQAQVIAAYMLFYAAGSGLGAVLGSALYATQGWLGVCVAGATVSVLALGAWALMRPAQPSRQQGQRSGGCRPGG